MLARFDGGPLNGKQLELPVAFLWVAVSDALKDEAEIVVDVPHDAGPNIACQIGSSLPKTRYALHYVKKGVAHYYLPTSW